MGRDRRWLQARSVAAPSNLPAVNQPWISVVIPAYNEERGIVAAVSALGAWLDEQDRPYEIVVVDNASEDETVERLRPLTGGPIRLIRNEENHGKGYSVRRGMLAASGRLRLHCDADCVPCLPSLPHMLDLIVRADVVVGSRLAEGARVGRRQPLPRRIVGRSFVELCRLLLREPTHDLFCGFKLWRQDAAVAVYSRTRLDGWTFDAESLAMAHALGYTVRETGIVWNERRGSRLSMARVLFPVVRELLAARRHVRREAAAARNASGASREPLVPEPVDPLP
jgi:dolichyl-phosphate beta-glucosyltransferase